MKPAAHTIYERQVQAAGASFRVRILEEDLSSVYPGMVRYTMDSCKGEDIVALCRTNSYEYSPCMPYHAREVALETVKRWESQLQADPETFPDQGLDIAPVKERRKNGGMVIIQGSPRPGGNCAILASWAEEAARDSGIDANVIFPHDLDIHPCIGCYQCYNKGSCVFGDDMTSIIDSVAESRLVVICSPVYTNTVPAGLKALIDRFQALHAEMTLGGNVHGGKGMLLAVAGRKGAGNFRCVTGVTKAFFSLIGISSQSPVLIDNMDEVRDIRRTPGIAAMVKNRVKACLMENP